MSTPRHDIFPRRGETELASPVAPSEPPSASEAPSVAPPASSVATRKRKVSTFQARAIDAMYATLGALQDHEVLSVRRGADPLEIRCAYESLLAAFHPRRFERTSLGEHAQKLDAVMRRIHEAYMALSSEAERTSHDARFGKPDP
jgi:hypothetical protein